MRCCKALLAISLCMLAAACGHIHPASVALEPNPPPPPDYAAVCGSLPLPLNNFITGCLPTQAAPAAQTAVVEARG